LHRGGRSQSRRAEEDGEKEKEEMKFAMPKGAVDTHMHFYDQAVAGAAGTPLPGHFPVADYRVLQKRLGLERVIVVQPNAYRDDNRVTLDAMAELGKSARGVAVVKAEVPDAELERLTRAGMRAVRIMTLHGGMLGFDVMDAVMARVHPFGWHANIQLDGRQLPNYEAQIKRLPGKFVIDHTGKYLEPVTTDHEAFKSLLRLVDTGRCWIKLSAPYETSKTGAPKYEDVGRLARALVKHAPERMMWASNWPHPTERKNPPDDEALLDLLADWAPDEGTRRKILVDNPAELYGF
jgi:D-galactarolactone isomerase